MAVNPMGGLDLEQVIPELTAHGSPALTLVPSPHPSGRWSGDPFPSLPPSQLSWVIVLTVLGPHDSPLHASMPGAPAGVCQPGLAGHASISLSEYGLSSTQVS